ncbi:MAG: hypothetical protein Q6362_000190 [Candidatus Wukongarchaeota archaeon]|nr:hypothetical protein [Candidatus Wukongarchaeota archaeon]
MTSSPRVHMELPAFHRVLALSPEAMLRSTGLTEAFTEVPAGSQPKALTLPVFRRRAPSTIARSQRLSLHKCSESDVDEFIDGGSYICFCLFACPFAFIGFHPPACVRKLPAKES